MRLTGMKKEGETHVKKKQQKNNNNNNNEKKKLNKSFHIRNLKK